MSQRFERRRPKGSGSSGDRPGPAGRGGGARPSRFGAPRGEWRGPAGGERDSRTSGEGRYGAGGDDRRSSFRREGGDRFGSESRPARAGDRRFEPRRLGQRRPERDGDARGEGRPAAFGAPSPRPSFAPRPAGKPSFGKPSYGKPSFGSSSFGRGGGGRPAAGRPRFGADRPRFAAERAMTAGPVEREGANGEAERFGAEPAEDLIWGRHPAQAALESERPIHRIWCTPELRFAPRFLQLLREAKAGGVLVEEVTWARLGQLTGGAVHQGIVLQVAAADTLDLDSLIEGCRGIGEPPLLMAVDGLTDPHNLGAIVRSAEALGAHGLVLPQRRNAGLTGAVAKVAAGALEHLPVARVVNLNRSLEQLKEEGYRVVGLAEEGTVCLSEADLDGPLVVVTGSEGQGLSMLTRKHCDQLIRIPLRGATPSLNASVATALLLYEIARRGWMKTISGNAPAPRIVRPQLATSAPAVSPPGASAGSEAPEPPAEATAIAPHPPEPEPQDEPAAEAEALAPPSLEEPAAEPTPAELTPAITVELTVPIEPAVELGFLPAAPSTFQGDIQL